MDKSHAYNTVWQVRSDAWCRLEALEEDVSSGAIYAGMRYAASPPSPKES